jgi:hypothetical protein
MDRGYHLCNMARLRCASRWHRLRGLARWASRAFGRIRPRWSASHTDRQAML